MREQCGLIKCDKPAVDFVTIKNVNPDTCPTIRESLVDGKLFLCAEHYDDWVQQETEWVYDD
jgi:hypothetical protein